MVELKKTLMAIMVIVSLSITYFMLLVVISYVSIDGIEFSINGSKLGFNELTYGNLKQFNIPSNTVFIVTDGEEQEDITTCSYDDETTIRSITVVVTNATNVCDFSVYGISVGSSTNVVDNMPKETVHTKSSDTGVLISRYIDKDGNVLIVGTDVELGIISYITIRNGN